MAGRVKRRTRKAAIASMRAFDSLPREWREFCANYPRTLNGQDLARVLHMARGNVAEAQMLLRDLLPHD